MAEKVNGISGQLHLLSGTNVAQIWASDMFCSHELPCWVSIVPAHSKAVTLGLVCDALCVCVVSIVVFSDAITVIEFWASSACGSPCPSYSHNQSIFHTLSLYPFSYCMHWAMTCFVHKLTKKKKTRLILGWHFYPSWYDLATGIFFTGCQNTDVDCSQISSMMNCSDRPIKDRKCWSFGVMWQRKRTLTHFI